MPSSSFDKFTPFQIVPPLLDKMGSESTEEEMVPLTRKLDTAAESVPDPRDQASSEEMKSTDATWCHGALSS